jgi:uncharacterized protein YbjT (DUF2867 family)
MVRILLLGASGLVGRETLQLALEHPEVEGVIAPSRLPLPIHTKLTNPVATQLENFIPEVARWSVNAVICALGTTMAKAGSQDAFRRVDHDLPLAFATAAHEQGAESLVLVSAIGASPSSRFFYAKTKGETERDLRSVGFARLTILRPMIIAGDRGETRIAENLVLALARVIGPLLGPRFCVNPASTIARVAVDAAVDPRQGVRVVYSPELTSRG